MGGNTETFTSIHLDLLYFYSRVMSVLPHSDNQISDTDDVPSQEGRRIHAVTLLHQLQCPLPATMSECF